MDPVSYLLKRKKRGQKEITATTGDGRKNEASQDCIGPSLAFLFSLVLFFASVYLYPEPDFLFLFRFKLISPVQKGMGPAILFPRLSV